MRCSHSFGRELSASRGLKAHQIRRLATIITTGALVCSGVVHAASAAEYPARPVRLIVAFAPGGSIDVVARLTGQKLAEAWGQQVVIDNRPGAGGNLSAEIAARAAPDGYTLYMSSASLVVNVSLYRKVGYDPMKDFSPVTLLASVQNVLVLHPSVRAKTLPDLIELARKASGQINYASTGSGSSGHLAMELFKNMARVALTHVPYKAVGQAQVDLMSGQVSLWFPTIPGALPHIRSGKMNALAVSGAARSPALPEMPTVAESALPGFEATTWYPILAPALTPTAIVDKLNRHLVTIVNTPAVKEQLMQSGVEPIGSSPAQLASHIKSELVKWAKVIQTAGVRLD